MPIDFSCAVCKNQIRVPDDSGGKKTKCPKCNAIQKIPDGSTPSQPSTPTPAPSDSDAGQSADIPGSVSASQGTSASGLGDDYWSQQSGAPAAPDSNNPFAADPGNPYSSPQQTSAYAPQTGRSKEDCKGRLMPPAIILMVLCGLSTLVTMLYVGIGISMVMGGGNEEDLFMAIYFGVSLLIHIVTLLGLYHAITMKNKAMAWFGIIMNMIPCGNICCIFILPLPFAIWGIVVLADAEVSRNFDS